MPSLNLNDKTISLTNLEKKLWPEKGIEKYHLIRYYLAISPYMLPHLKDRPLVCKRFPQGIKSPGFYQKNLPQGAPAWINTFSFKHSKRVINYILATGPETLAWLGNQGCLEIHTWLSSTYNIKNPDFAVFDLDPAESVRFSQVCEAALLLKELLEGRGYKCYVKTSGKSGLQVYLPLEPVYSFKQVREFVAGIFNKMHNRKPELTTMERDRSKRGQKIYLDFRQNAPGKTMVAPYSPRPLKGAPVSTPLEWSELYNPSFSPLSFTINTILDRLKRKNDLFRGVITERQRLFK